MKNLNRNICKDFENTVWLFLDNELSPQEMEFWHSHIVICEKCSSILDSISTVTNSAKEELLSEMSISTFNNILLNIFNRKKRKSLISFLPKIIKYFKPLRIKYAVAIVFIILGFIISLNITKQKSLHSLKADSMVETKFFGLTYTAKLSKMVEMVYGNEFDKQIISLENQINDLNVK